MARLTIQNVAAPNLSGTSQILANAAASLNTGLSAASGVLDKYAAGQQESADASVLSTIAGISSEEELGKFLGSGQLEGLNLSASMRETVLGLRNRILANDQTRANIGQTHANTGLIGANTDRVRASSSIAQAAEGRTAAEYQDGVNVRNARRALTPAVVGANVEGNRQGQNGFTRDAPASLLRTESGGNFNASNNEVGSSGRNGHFGRVQFGQDRFEEARRAGAIPSGMTIEQFGTNTPEGRAAQQSAENWHFADIQNYISSNGLDQYIGTSINGVTMTRDGLVAMAHLGGSNGMKRFLESGGQYNPSDSFGTSLQDYAQTHAGNTTGRTNRPAFTNLQEAIAASVYLDPADATKLLADAYAAQNLGQQRINSTNTAAQQEASAAAILAAVQDPTNVNTKGVVTDLINNSLVGNSNERIEAIARAQGLAGENGPLAGVLAPRVSTNETIRNSIELFNGREGSSINSAVQTRLLNDSQQYVEDPAGTLMNQFGMESTPELRNDMRTIINTLARETGVTPQLAAVALAENFNRNDTWGADPAADRFYVENARSFIETNLSENALSRFNEQRVVSESRQRQVESLRLQLDTLRSQAAKYGANVPPALAQNIQSLQTQILTATNGSIPEPTSKTQAQAPVQQNAGAFIAAAATPQPVVQQPTIQLPAAQNNPIPKGQSGQVQLEPDTFNGKLTLEEAEYNRVQLRDYIETSGYREQLSATQPGSADRQLVIEALARRIQDDTRLTDAEKQGLLSAITGGN